MAITAVLTSLAAAAPAAAHNRIPADANQLIVLSSATYAPLGHLGALRVYQQRGSGWHLVFGPWKAEIGYGDLRDSRREGDGSTPTGVFGIGDMIYGNRPNPGGLHYAYHRLVCGDWWDEDPHSPGYNRFVHAPCGTRPAFAALSERLWTETTAYPYFAVMRFNMNPTIRGRGSGIFLHSWVGGATAGCVALPRPRLLAVLRWLRPSAHPAIDIGTDHEVRPLATR